MCWFVGLLFIGIILSMCVLVCCLVPGGVACVFGFVVSIVVGLWLLCCVFGFVSVGVVCDNFTFCFCVCVGLLFVCVRVCFCAWLVLCRLGLFVCLFVVLFYVCCCAACACFLFGFVSGGFVNMCVGFVVSVLAGLLFECVLCVCVVSVRFVCGCFLCMLASLLGMCVLCCWFCVVRFLCVVRLLCLRLMGS